ncbi:MAG: Prephenate dehydratase [Firmicutes bacterium ADurb.Bin193]|nr:MAG: Prephenate dehydratase [Firmicutes bacterium ADurb.Bin193]
MKIGYLGPDGTFSHTAALRFAKEGNHETVQYQSIPELAAAAQNLSVDAAVLPIENSLEGGVNTTLDCLAFDCDLKITGEILLQVHQNLLSNSEKIIKIYSHPQPVGQCGRYLAKNFPSVPIVFTNSTAEAAILAQKEEGAAAIGSDTLADIYGLKIVAKDIEDANTNTTRFVVAQRDGKPDALADKTSIVFSVSDTPGALFKMLSVFDIFEINLVKIESRPAKTVLGEYIFFVDISGSAENDNIKMALETVRYKSTFFKVLGSYKEDKSGV